MPQPRTEDRKIVAFPDRPVRADATPRAHLAGEKGRVVPFTGVRLQRFSDDAAFAAAIAALSVPETGRLSG